MSENLGAPARYGRPRLAVSSLQDSDGCMRLVLAGDFDLSSVGMFATRIQQLRDETERLRLDLFQVEFIDSAALGALVTVLEDARTADWMLEVDERVGPVVRRVIELTRTESVLWPEA